MKKLDIFILKNQQMSVNAGTVLKVLGKPPINWADIIVRESIQNSLDAVIKENNNKIKFEINILNRNNINELINDLIFLKQDENDLLFKRLSSRIKLGDPAILVLRDSGTSGLSGPIRRDDVNWSLNKERKNFDNLVYQLGINHGTSGAGGSYGFGKSSYFHLSQSGLVLYYSRSKEGQRIAFSMISERENKEELATTGICWWGEKYIYDNIEYAAPITDEKRIYEILTSLKINNQAFIENEYGTLIAIIAPDLNKLIEINNDEIENDNEIDLSENENFTKNEEKIGKVYETFKKCILKWYWPRIFETSENNQNGKLKPLEVYLNNQKLDLPKQLIEMGKLLVSAENSNNNKVIEENENIKIERINHKFGNVLIGSLAYKKINISLIENSDYFNKIAMIREPRMVVYYQDVQKRQDQTTISVFLVNSMLEVKSCANDLTLQKLDNAFRDSESATHSEWNYQIFDESKKWFKAYVKKAKEETLRIINNSLIDNQPLVNSKTLSVIAKNLGKLLSSESPGGLGVIKKGGVQSSRNNNQERKIKVISTVNEFEDNNVMTLNILLSNFELNVYYRIILLAKSTNESLSHSQWNQKLGGGFPFKLISANSQYFFLNIENNENYIDFMIDKNNIKQADLFLKIKVEKMDSLISFEINKSKI